MIDTIAFLLMGGALALRLRRRALAERKRATSSSEAPALVRVSFVRGLTMLALILGPLTLHTFAFAEFLEERRLPFFLNSLRASQCWSFFLAGGYAYGLLCLAGVAVAGLLYVVAPDPEVAEAESNVSC